MMDLLGRIPTMREDNAGRKGAVRTDTGAYMLCCMAAAASTILVLLSPVLSKVPGYYAFLLTPRSR